VYLLKAQTRIDEFAFILLAGIILIVIIAVAFTTVQGGPITGTLSTSNLQIAQGNSATITLHLNGTGYNITLSSSGEISNWINFDQNNFDLSGLKDVVVTILVPGNADFRTHTGNILVIFGDKTVKIPINIAVTIVTVTNVPNAIRLGDFTVSYLVGNDVVGEQDNIQVSKGYFSSSPVSFTATVPDNEMGILTDGFIQIFVEASNPDGNLFVDFNGQRIYSNTISTGEIDIPINAMSIHKYNSVVLSADNPGVKFWESTSYKIKFVKFAVDFNGINSKTFTFSLSSTDLNNFNFGTLSFQVKNYNPYALGQMLVQINGVTFFNDVPTLTYFSRSFGNEIPLYNGNNTISFSVSSAGSYQLANAVLTIVHHI
jgi:hypothetical protein